MLRKDHCRDESQIAEQQAQNQRNDNRVSFNLGGPLLILMTLGCAVMLGLDIAERASQERRATAEARAVQHSIDKQTADLERAWVVNTQQIMRDWSINTAQMQRDWETQTAINMKKMDDLQRQYRMAELKLDDTTVVLHRAGLQLPGDYTRGPQGNMDTESFKFASSPVWPCNEDSSILCTTVINGGDVWEQAESSISEQK